MRSVWLSATIAQTRVSSFCMTHSFISVATIQELLLLLPKRKDEGIITMATMISAIVFEKPKKNASYIYHTSIPKAGIPSIVSCPKN